MFKGYVLLIFISPTLGKIHCRGYNLKEKPLEGWRWQDEDNEGFLKD